MTTPSLILYKPPFSPDDVAKEFANTIKSFGIASVRGDRYGGIWPRERLAVHGVDYQPATESKSDIYLNLLPFINSGRVELLDHPRLTAQLCALERRTARGGRDSIDHSPGAHDDIINAAAGAIVMAAQRTAQRVPIVSPIIVGRHQPSQAAPFRRRQCGANGPMGAATQIFGDQFSEMITTD